MQMEQLLAQYPHQTVAARHSAEQAAVLFDALQPVHRLRSRWQAVLLHAALLRFIGKAYASDDWHLIGRDIVLDSTLGDLPDRERVAIASVIALQRKRSDAATEPAFLALRPKARRAVQHLVAMLRLADALDAAQTASTSLCGVDIQADGITLLVTGEHSAANAKRAQRRASLLAAVLERPVKIAVTDEVDDLPVTIVLAQPQPASERNGHGTTVVRAETTTDGAQASPASETAVLPESMPDALTDAPAADDDSDDSDDPVTTPEDNRLPYDLVATTDSVALAGQRLLRRAFQSLIEHEPIALEGSDPEGVHQMRVYTRRMRAVLQLLSPVAPEHDVRIFRKELQRLARTLGPVRDADVFLEQLAALNADMTDEQHAGIDYIVQRVNSERREHRATMQAYLASPRYAQFKHTMACMLVGSLDGWDTATRVRDLVGSMLWRRYEEVRAYERLVDPTPPLAPEAEETLHMARIAGKRLRYVLDTFGMVFDDQEQARCLKPLKALQEHLGTLQDIAVATVYVRALPTDDATRPGITAYLARREAERHGLLSAVPDNWQRVIGVTYRRNLARLLVLL